jgi:hypothetical protein
MNETKRILHKVMVEILILMDRSTVKSCPKSVNSADFSKKIFTLRRGIAFSEKKPLL